MVVNGAKIVRNIDYGGFAGNRVLIHYYIL